MVMAKSVPTINNTDNLSFENHCRLKSHGPNHSVCSLKSPRDLVIQVMKDKVADIDVNTCAPGEEDAFYVADLGEVYRQHLRWKLNLSQVKPFYGKSLLELLSPPADIPSGQVQPR